MPALQLSVNVHGTKAENGFRILNTYRDGHYCYVFDEVFFIAPASATAYRPYDLKYMKIFKKMTGCHYSGLKEGCISELIF